MQKIYVVIGIMLVNIYGMSLSAMELEISVSKKVPPRCRMQPVTNVWGSLTRTVKVNVPENIDVDTETRTLRLDRISSILFGTPCTQETKDKVENFKLFVQQALLAAIKEQYSGDPRFVDLEKPPFTTGVYIFREEREDLRVGFYIHIVDPYLHNAYYWNQLACMQALLLGQPDDGQRTRVSQEGIEIPLEEFQKTPQEIARSLVQMMRRAPKNNDGSCSIETRRSEIWSEYIRKHLDPDYN